MSTIEIIVSRMINEPDFAEALFANPENALSEYNLSNDEIARFKELDHANFNTMTPEERKSMIAFVGGWGASSYQYGYGGY